MGVAIDLNRQDLPNLPLNKKAGRMPSQRLHLGSHECSTVAGVISSCFRLHLMEVAPSQDQVRICHGKSGHAIHRGELHFLWCRTEGKVSGSIIDPNHASEFIHAQVCGTAQLLLGEDILNCSFSIRRIGWERTNQMRNLLPPNHGVSAKVNAPHL